MSGEVRSNSCLAKGRRRHFRKFCAFARFVRRDVIMVTIIRTANLTCSALPPRTNQLCFYFGPLRQRANQMSPYFGYYEGKRSKTTNMK